MIDIAKYRWWEEGVILVDGCTPCSPGCDHCWSAAQHHRFNTWKNGWNPDRLTNIDGRFNGEIITHPDRLTRFNTRKPKVFAIWNDLFHADVPDEFIDISLSKMEISADHPPWGDKVYKTQFGADGCYEPNKYLILTKRPLKMLQSVNSFLDSFSNQGIAPRMDHIYFGLTVCNQQEWDDKERWFLQIPGKKFISHEPALEAIHYGEKLALIDCLVSGGETGFGARPSHPDIFRSDRDQCAAAGVDFFFKQWGEWTDDVNSPLRRQSYCFDPIGKQLPVQMYRVGRKKAGRLLDGRTHDDLPWVKKEGER